MAPDNLRETGKQVGNTLQSRVRTWRGLRIRRSRPRRYECSGGKIADALKDAGFRTPHFPASTAVRKSLTMRLKASGSSILMVWPHLGMTTSPAGGNGAFHE